MESIANNASSCAYMVLHIKSVYIGKYQKSLNSKRVDEIVKNYDPHRMRAIDISWRDNKYWCFDGQHRLAAYIKMGMRKIPAMVHTGLTCQLPHG